MKQCSKSENVLIIDSDYEEADGFIKGVREVTGEEWQVALHENNKIYGWRRYVRFFTVALQTVLSGKKYEGKTVLCWQQFYGIAIAFFQRMFHMKKRYKLVIMTFIYKEKRGLAGKLFYRFVRYAVTSRYVDKIILTTQSEKPMYQEIFGVEDDFFEVYSAVDERAAAFMACGLAEESEEPVVLSCTGATASRNYIPGLTEAYYRHLPVLAITSTQHTGRIGHYYAQVIDRSVTFPDVVKKSIQLPSVFSEEDRQYTITAVNDGLLELMHREKGPVHFNLTTVYSAQFTTEELPKCRVIHRIMTDEFPKIPVGKIGIYVGAHEAFSPELTAAIDAFCEANNAVVICDQISNYRGKYRFLASLVNNQEKEFGTRIFDLIIYIGSVHGTYLRFVGEQLWRVNPDGEIRDCFRNLTYVFEMEETTFFKHYSEKQQENTLIDICIQAQKKVNRLVPEVPFSNIWIAKETADRIPANSVIHFGILNSLRSWNFFETPEDVLCYANTGGFGIDGCLSSCIGAAISNPKKEHYLIIGDLAFFYDLNSICNAIPCNVHILLVNNGVGTEFKNYDNRAAMFGMDADPFMAAKGHNGFRNSELVKKLCANLGVMYMCAFSKEEYNRQKEQWLCKHKSPVLLEVFTNDKEESQALLMMNSLAKNTGIKAELRKTLVYKFAKKLFRR